MDHRRYWFKEKLVIMVLAGNNGLLVNLDITGFLGSISFGGHGKANVVREVA